MIIMGRKSIDKIRKPQILEHFREVVNQEGIHKASVAKIAKKMGVSPNLVLHYFDSKEAMVIELFDYIMDQYIEYLVDAISNIQKGPQRLEALIKTMFGLGKNRELLSEKSYYAFYYLSLFDEQMKIRFNNKYKKLTRVVIMEFESMPFLQDLNRADSKKYAEFLVDLFEGFIFKANVTTNPEYFEEYGEFFYKKAWAFLKNETTVEAEEPSHRAPETTETKRFVKNLSL